MMEVWIRVVGASLVAQQENNPPAMQETQEMQLQSLGWEDNLEEERAAHSCILAWKIRGAWQAVVQKVIKSQTQLSNWAVKVWC